MGLNAGMPRTHTTLAIRLNFARKKRRLRQEDLAAKAGVGQSQISKLENGTTSETAAIAKIARALAIPVDWLELGDGPEPDWELPYPPSNRQLAPPFEAQSFEDQALTSDRIKEMISADEVPAQFVYALEDDAMGKFGKAGARVLFHRANSAPVGAGVLVQDGSGALYVRRKAQGRQDSHWLAMAPNELYRSLDSERDGLTLVAVWRGVINRGLEDE